MARPKDYGDQYPADSGDSVPSNPADGYSEFAGIISRPYKKAPKLETTYNFTGEPEDNRVDIAEQKEIYVGYIVEETTTEVDQPRLYNVFLQNGQTVSAQQPSQLESQKYLEGSTVAVIVGDQANQFVIIGQLLFNDLNIISIEPDADSDIDGGVTLDLIENWSIITDPNNAEWNYGETGKKPELDEPNKKIVIHDNGLYEVTFCITYTDTGGDIIWGKFTSPVSGKTSDQMTSGTMNVWEHDSAGAFTDASKTITVYNPSSGQISADKLIGAKKSGSIYIAIFEDCE